MPTLGQYQRPYVGQPFRMTHNSERYIEGQVSGISVTGHTINPETGERIEDWTAVISSGIEGDGRIYARAQMVDGGWLPIPEEECSKRYGVGYARLRESIDSLASEVDERLEVINDNINDVVKSVVDLVTTSAVAEAAADVTVVAEAAADVTVVAETAADVTEPPARRRRAG